MTTGAALGLVLLAAPPGDPAEAVARFGEGLEVDPRAVAEIRRFEQDGRRPDEAYAGEIAGAVRRLVFAEAGACVRDLLAGTAKPRVEVTFLKAGFAAGGEKPRSEVAREFEDGFVRTEVVALLRGTDATPERALRTYTDPAFRARISSRIEDIQAEDGLDCVHTRGVGPFLSPMRSCSRIDEMLDAVVASQHSQTVVNDGGDGLQTVFFKESLKTFVGVPGGVAFHYVSYSRTDRFGRVGRAIGGRKARAAQEGAVRELAAELEATLADE